jgi:hypothetical protein
MTAFAEKHYRSLLFAIWLATSLLLLFVARGAIADWKMGDPDDQLRLVQVRDWLAGQSWWDITQHRMNPPDGGPMHWSRMVDVPIAAIILLLRPLLGQAVAEQWASALIPLLVYGLVLWTFAATAKRLFGNAPGLLAAATFFTILPATMQILPMRIDHHGWQLFCFFLGSWALFDPKRSLLSAAIIGLAMALWIEISIEGLPFAIVFMGVLALRWLADADQPEGNQQLPVALAALAGGTGFFYLITEGFNAIANHCDGLSPFHIGAFFAVAVVFGVGSRFAKSLPVKLAVGGIAAAAGLAIVLSVAPQCTRDAFADLDPLVREYWYYRVPEGLPLWDISLNFAMQQIAGLAFGIVGLVWMLRASSLQKQDRLALALLFIGSAAVGSLVSRTMVYAICLGTIMLAPMAIALFAAAEQRTGLGPRMGLRIIAILLLGPTIVGQNITNRLEAADQQSDPQAANTQKRLEGLARICQKAKAANALNRLPTAQLMVGLDTSPAILQFTRHKVVATGHHRNADAMADVIRTFTGDVDQAKTIFRKRQINYLVTCDGSFELNEYQVRNPDGFIAQMRRGETPEWLVRQPDIGPFHIWRFAP